MSWHSLKRTLEDVANLKDQTWQTKFDLFGKITILKTGIKPGQWVQVSPPSGEKVWQVKDVIEQARYRGLNPLDVIVTHQRTK